MARKRAHRATPGELYAIDEGLNGPTIPAAELPAFYRREAGRLRWKAEAAEAPKMRVALIKAAQQFEAMADRGEHARPN